MYKVIYEHIKGMSSKEKFISPQIPPNNLKKIKEIYSYTDDDIGKLINVKAGFVSGVVNNRANFSGITTLKLLKELDISFSTLYGMKRKLVTNCESFKEGVFIISLDNKYTETLIYDVTKELLYNDDDIVPTFMHIELDIVNDKLTLDSKRVPRILSDDEKEYIRASIKAANNNNSFDNNYGHYLIYYTTKSYEEMEYEIDTEKALDVETNNILFSLPFNKYINTTLPPSDFKLDLNNVILNQDFTILRDNKLIQTKILYNNEYNFLSDGQSIIFKTFSTEKSMNKLKLYRDIKGYDLHYMANALNLSAESYRVMEVGHNRISTSQMWKIENRLGIQLENIIDINAYIENFSK